jgi:hypothetical protein
MTPCGRSGSRVEGVAEPSFGRCRTRWSMSAGPPSRDDRQAAHRPRIVIDRGDFPRVREALAAWAISIREIRASATAKPLAGSRGSKAVAPPIICTCVWKARRSCASIFSSAIFYGAIRRGSEALAHKVICVSVCHDRRLTLTEVRNGPQITRWPFERPLGATANERLCG